jgi:hypothetical protein
MVCAELQQLRQRYELSLRVWAHYAFPLPEDVLQFPGRLSQLKQEAQIERDLAARELAAQPKEVSTLYSKRIEFTGSEGVSKTSLLIVPNLSQGEQPPTF